MPIPVRPKLVEAKPMRRDDTGIKRSAGFNLIQLAIESKAQVSDITSRYSPLVDTHQSLRGDVATGFFQRLTYTAGDK